nr:thioredoxin-related transmembrane protein 2 homolog [Dermatophagoides farinae]
MIRMAIINTRDLHKVCHPHYLVNILLAFSFLVLKLVPPFCNYLFKECQLEHRDTEILFFTIVIIMFRTRKQGNVTFLPYLSSACMLMKLGNILLYFNAGPLYGIVFGCCCLLQMLLLPEPTYQGPENIAYMKGEDLEEEIGRDKRVVWLVELYAAWSPPCVDFANVFAELSNKYSLDNLRFAKVDLARNPDTATKYRINISTLSKQLPTVILFMNGHETMRRPLVNEKGKLVNFAFTFDNVVMEYDLDQIYKQCRNNPLTTVAGSMNENKKKK